MSVAKSQSRKAPFSDSTGGQSRPSAWDPLLTKSLSSGPLAPSPLPPKEQYQGATALADDEEEMRIDDKRIPFYIGSRSRARNKLRVAFSSLPLFLLAGYYVLLMAFLGSLIGSFEDERQGCLLPLPFCFGGSKCLCLTMFVVEAAGDDNGASLP